MTPPRVLLTNDDGPPNPTDSPYVLGLYRHLRSHLGWDVKVVLPSTQKSWSGKAYHIKEITKGSYFYPRDDGLGDISSQSRPLKDGELDEWILLDGTPATCVNIALHNLYPGEIDIVVSGPNLGRNTSCTHLSPLLGHKEPEPSVYSLAAFSLSSGTVGAAMSAALSKKRSIAISYGSMGYPTPTEYFEPAHLLGCRIIGHLWQNWGSDGSDVQHGDVDLYSVNLPLIERLLSGNSLKICWTRIWRNSYGRLFESAVSLNTATLTDLTIKATNEKRTATDDAKLLFRWSPDIESITDPSIDTLPVGSDAWALHQGWVSVTPLRSTFGEPPYPNEADVNKSVWTIKF